MLAKNPALFAQAQIAWTVVVTRIEDRATTRRPKPPNFEVHHETEIARETFLTAIALGHTPAEATAEALKRIKIE